jgi:hypothetical protein
MPTSSIPAMSRTIPSVTQATMPLFFAMATNTSPMTDASSYALHAITRTSPGLHAASAAQQARLSRGRVCTVTATPQKALFPVSGRIR